MPKKSIAKVGHQMPSNLKFGIIVAVAVFWANFLKSLLSSIFESFMDPSLRVVADLIVAVTATIIAYIILVSYRKIRNRLKDVKV